jgi:hypothetical protein
MMPCILHPDTYIYDTPRPTSLLLYFSLRHLISHKRLLLQINNYPLPVLACYTPAQSYPYLHLPIRLPPYQPTRPSDIPSTIVLVHPSYLISLTIIMSPNLDSDINQPPNEGTRARANTSVSTTAQSTIRSIASPVPSTPNLQRDGEVAEYTPAGQDDIATPPTQPFSRLSISARRTLDLGNRVGDTDEPKVPHQLAASAQIESGGTVSSPPSVVTHGSLGADDHTEAVQRSPDSDPFEFDDNASTHSSVASHEPSTPSDQVGADDDANVAQHLPTSDQSYSDQEETVYSNVVQ